MMINIYTVSFFGHRYIEQEAEIESRLDRILHELINEKEYVDFLIGRDGEFDMIASAAIRKAVSSYGYGNTHLTLVLPYMKADFRKNEENFLEYYDEVEICEKSADAHPKSAILIRNQSMIDRSDLVICCITHKSGGAYKTVQYAKKQGKKILNIIEEI